MSNQSNSEDQSTAEEDLVEDYYSILNVSKSANDKEITQAYHRYGLIYHPDKQKDPEGKRNAEVLFSKIKKAYDVLIDPLKRAIYDSVGLKGLQQEGLQIAVRSKTPQEIREEYERISKEREERRLEKLTYSQGYFSMQIDASRIFDSFSDPNEQYFPRPKQPFIGLGNFNMMQSLDFPLSISDTVTLSGTLNTQDKYGNGSVSASLKRVLTSDGVLELKASVGAMPGLTASFFKRLTQKCNGSINGILRYKNGSVAPIMVGTVNYQLDTHLIGQMQYKTGLNFINSHMSTALIYEKDNLSANIRFQLSVKNSFVAAQIARKITDWDLKLKSSAQYGYMGITFSYGIEKQITQFSKIDASMVINTLAGVALHIELERGMQKFVVPIHLSRDVIPSAVFYGTVTPIVCYYIVKKMLIDPYLRDKEEAEAKIKQERLRTEMLEKKRLAFVAQNLMKETVSRIIEKESPNGLIVTKALYGKVRLEDKSESRTVVENEKLVDVTIPLQFLVKDHSLHIVNDQPKSNLEGFYDPCIGETKVLFVQYKYNGELYETTLDDDQLVRLPKASHKVQWWSRPFSNVRNQ